jgi:hypothetical protein
MTHLHARSDIERTSSGMPGERIAYPNTGPSRPWRKALWRVELFPFAVLVALGISFFGTGQAQAQWWTGVIAPPGGHCCCANVPVRSPLFVPMSPLGVYGAGYLGWAFDSPYGAAYAPVEPVPWGGYWDTDVGYVPEWGWYE